MLTVLVFPVAVVGSGEIRITVLVLVGLVSNAKVMTISEYWTPVFPIVNCVLWLSESHFLFEFELEEERTRRIISDPSLDRTPFEWCVGCDGFAELSADDGHCVADTIAAFVELRDSEVVL